MLTLLNERTPVDQFDLVGVFDFNDQIDALDAYRQIALDNRPDLKAAVQAVDKAQTDYKLAVANGSTDPTISFDMGRNPPIDLYIGVDVSIPLRIFDRNQGNKLHTKLDIARNEKLRDAAEAQVFNDVDSAYATLNSNVILLRPYKRKYLAQALRVQDTILFFLPVRRRFAAGFPLTRDERLPQPAIELRESGGSLVSGRQRRN